LQFSTDNLVAIAIASISGVAFVTSATIPLLFSIRKQVKETATNAQKSVDAVVNDHPKNLRDDLDEKFNALHISIQKLSDKDIILARKVSTNKGNITKQNKIINEIKKLLETGNNV
jgi:hypothetical protein